MKKRRIKGIESKKSMYGFLFILPWLFGISTLFLIPIGQSLWYAVSKVSFDDVGNTVAKFSGIENIKYIFTTDPNFLTNLKDSILSFAYSMPIIVILSLLFAVALNQNFKGRMFARAIFFLPVIIATGVVMEQISTATLVSVTGEGNSYANGMINFNDVLSKMNFPPTVVEIFSESISRIFNLVWSMGIQVVLFISGLQTIPSQMYEVSKVEGATKWEEFWYVTIPMMRNIIALVIMFTMVDLFVTSDNKVVTQAYSLFDSQAYDLSSAMLWCYFAFVIAVSGAVLGLYYKSCMKRWE